MNEWLDVLVRWWASLTSRQVFYLQLAGLILWLWGGGYVGYYFIRLGLGHRRYGRRWYNAEEWDKLMQVFHEAEQQRGFLPYCEAYLLDEYRNGGRSRLRRLAQRDRLFN